MYDDLVLGVRAAHDALAQSWYCVDSFGTLSLPSCVKRAR